MAAEHEIVDEPTLIAHVLALSSPANGNDAAVVDHSGRICVSTDSTVAGVHAPLTSSPHQLGRRAAARALSDLAAMGAAPIGITCAVHVPPDAWDAAAAALTGLAQRAGEQGASLVGGDVTRLERGELALIVTVLGSTEDREPATRSGMVPGDELWVTGTLGGAAHALAAGDVDLPEPPDRLLAGAVLARWVHAMIDVSDGVAADAGHLARASGCDARIDLQLLPMASDATDRIRATQGGDDYELLVALAPQDAAAAAAGLATACPGLAFTRIGSAVDGAGSARFTDAGVPVVLGDGFAHR